MMKSLILPDGSWGGNFEQWEYENYPTWNFTDVLYNNQFDYYPKFDDVNQEWYESATQYQISEFNIKLQILNDLEKSILPITRWVHQRYPMTSRQIMDIKRAYAKEKHDLLEFDPNYIFPDYSKIPRMELTYRQIIETAGTSVVMSEYIDSDVLTEVEIEGTKVYGFTWDYGTQTLSGINVNIGDHLKIMF